MAEKVRKFMESLFALLGGRRLVPRPVRVRRIR